MLMRTDPFRELDRVAQQVLGTAARPAAMPIDAYRRGDEFVALFDLPGVAADSIELTVERNVLTVHAERSRPEDEDVELLIGERPHGTFSRQLFLAETLDTERIDRRLHRRRAAPPHPGPRAGQAAPCGHRRRQRDDTIEAPARTGEVAGGREEVVTARAGRRRPGEPGAPSGRSPTRPPRSTGSARRRRCSPCKPRSCGGSTPRVPSYPLAPRAGSAATAATSSTMSPRSSS